MLLVKYWCNFCHIFILQKQKLSVPLYRKPCIFVSFSLFLQLTFTHSHTATIMATFLDSNTQWLFPSSSTWFHHRSPTIRRPVMFWGMESNSCMCYTLHGRRRLKAANAFGVCLGNILDPSSSVYYSQDMTMDLKLTVINGHFTIDIILIMTKAYI